MLNLYFDSIEVEYIDIDKAGNNVNFYLIQTHDKKNQNQEKYKLCATTQDLDLLPFDPETKIKEYWPIPINQIRENINLLFDKNDCNLLMASFEIKQDKDIPDYAQLTIPANKDALVLINEKLYFVDIKEKLVKKVDEIKLDSQSFNTLIKKCRNGQAADENDLKSISSLTDRIPWCLMKSDPMTDETTMNTFNIDFSKTKPFIFSGVGDIEIKFKYYLSHNNNEIREAGNQFIAIVEGSSLTQEEKADLYLVTYKMLRNPGRHSEEFTSKADKLSNDGYKDLARDVLMVGGIFAFAYCAQWTFEWAAKNYVDPFMPQLLPAALYYYYDQWLSFHKAVYSYPVGAIISRSLIVANRMSDSPLITAKIPEGLKNISRIQIAGTMKTIKTELEKQKNSAIESRDNKPKPNSS